MKKNNNKTRRRELLEARFDDLANERKAELEVPESLAENVFETLERIGKADDPQNLIPHLQEKIMDLFAEEQE